MSGYNLIAIADKMASILVTDVQLIGMSDAHKDVLQKFSDFCESKGITPSSEVKSALSNRGIDLARAPRVALSGDSTPMVYEIPAVDAVVELLFDDNYNREMNNEDFINLTKKICETMDYEINHIHKTEILHRKKSGGLLPYNQKYHHICRIVIGVSIDQSIGATTEEELLDVLIPRFCKDQGDRLEKKVNAAQFKMINSTSDIVIKPIY